MFSHFLCERSEGAAACSREGTGASEQNEKENEDDSPLLSDNGG